MWGGVSGHSVNLRDQCSVCDVVTVQQGWMRRSSVRRHVWQSCEKRRDGKRLQQTTVQSKPDLHNTTTI